MPFFDATLAAVAAGESPALAILVEFDFADGFVRLWDGHGVITVEGEDYSGVGEWGAISAVPFGANDSAGQVTFTLSGVDAAVLAAAKNAESVRGRDVSIYGQFLSAAFVPLDSKFVIRQLIMDKLAYSATGPRERKVSLTAETIWTNRNAAAYAHFTDRDQQARFPGDKGLEHVPTLKNKTIIWPNF